MRSILVAALILTLGGCGEEPFKSHVLTQVERLAAENGAMLYANHADARFIQCFNTDSNGDKFITCTTQNKTSGEITEISCSYVDGKSGCRRKVNGPLPRVEEKDK